MEKETIFLVAIAISFFVCIVIWEIKDSVYQKGIKKGESIVVTSMLDTSKWMGNKDDKSCHNALFLFANKYKKYGYVSSDRFRNDYQKLDRTERVTLQDLEHLI